MNTPYSELIGSFIRTGDYPLEANYIFPTEESLKEFYSDELKATILHKGLLKIVEKDEDGKQALYWVTKKIDSDELEFTKLISANNIESLFEELENLESKLEQEIKLRKSNDDLLRGTESASNLPKGLTNILELANALSELRLTVSDLRQDMEDKTSSLKDELKEVVGTEEDDIISYLQTLDYSNLTKVSEALNHFLNIIDEEDASINTLPELKEFLRGFEYTHNLYECFVDFWNSIQGTPTPNTLFRTLRGILDFVETLSSVVKNRCDNLQKELDLTQVGVGLSGDGSYNADQETHYLKNATSVMNALKTLDGLINEAINNVNLQAGETKSAKTEIIKEKNKTTLYTQVKLASQSGNDIQLKNDGLYHNIDTEYDLNTGVLSICVNGTLRKLHNLGLSFVGIHDANYHPDTESIVIEFEISSGKTKVLNIPVGNLIAEWEIDNSLPGKVVELTKTRNTGPGPDILFADVRISDKDHNILKRDNNTLYVKGTADNIILNGDVTVESKLLEIEEGCATKEEIELQISESLIGYAKEEWIELLDYVTNQTLTEKLEGYATKDEFPGGYDDTDLKERISKLEAIDHSKYLTEHQPLDGLAKSDDVTKEIEDAIAEVEAKIPSIDGLATEEYVDEAIEGLSEVYQPIGNYLTEVPKEYATETFVRDRVKEGIDGIIDGASTAMDTLKEVEEALSKSKDTVEALNNAIGSKASREELEEAVTDMATQTWVTEQNYLKQTNLNGYATEEWVEAKNYALKSEIKDCVKYTPFENRKTISLNEGDTISSIGINIGMVKTYDGLYYEEENPESGKMPVLEIGGQKGALVLNTCEDRVKVEVVEDGERILHPIATLEDIPSLEDYPTRSEVTELIVSTVTGGEILLEGYATEQWVKGLKYAKLSEVDQKIEDALTWYEGG